MSKSSITIEAIALPPIHPGEILADEIAELGLSASRFAHALDIPANRVTEIIAGRRAVSADTALRLERYGIGSARHWLALQASHDIARARAESGDRINTAVKPRAA